MISATWAPFCVYMRRLSPFSSLSRSGKGTGQFRTTLKALAKDAGVKLRLLKQSQQCRFNGATLRREWNEGGCADDRLGHYACFNGATLRREWNGVERLRSVTHEIPASMEPLSGESGMKGRLDPP